MHARFLYFTNCRIVSTRRLISPPLTFLPMWEMLSTTATVKISCLLGLMTSKGTYFWKWNTTLSSFNAYPAVNKQMVYWFIFFIFFCLFITYPYLMLYFIIYFHVGFLGRFWCRTYFTLMMFIEIPWFFMHWICRTQPWMTSSVKMLAFLSLPMVNSQNIHNKCPCKKRRSEI